MSATGRSEGNGGARVPQLPGIAGNAAVGVSPPALGSVSVNTAMSVPGQTAAPAGQCVTVGGRTFVYPNPPPPVLTPMSAAMAYDDRTAAALQQEANNVRVQLGLQPVGHLSGTLQTPTPPPTVSSQPPQQQQPPPQQQQPPPQQQQQQQPPQQQQQPPPQHAQQHPALQTTAPQQHVGATSRPGRTTTAASAQPVGMAAESQPRRQLTWGHEGIHAMLVEVNARKDEFPNDKEGMFNDVAAALLAGPQFGGQAERGAIVSGKKVREKFNTLVKAAKDGEKRAAFLSGVRSSQYAHDIERELDEAVAHDNQVQEDRARLAAGRAATTSFGEQRGHMGTEQAFTGRQECTALALRPEPKDTKGVTGRPSRRNDPLPAQSGMVDTKEAMTIYMQQSATRHAAEGDRAEKRIKLEEHRFAYDVRKEEREREEREARRQRELDNEAKKIVIEENRLANETQLKQDQLAAEKKKEEDRHTLSTLQENNRAAEAKRAFDLQMDAQKKQAESQAKQAESQALQMKMMFDMMQAALQKKD